MRQCILIIKKTTHELKVSSSCAVIMLLHSFKHLRVFLSILNGLVAFLGNPRAIFQLDGVLLSLVLLLIALPGLILAVANISNPHNTEDKHYRQEALGNCDILPLALTPCMTTTTSTTMNTILYLTVEHFLVPLSHGRGLNLANPVEGGGVAAVGLHNQPPFAQ